MAKMTLLQMVQQACGELGVPQPNSVADTTNAIAVQMLSLANREGRECARAEGSAGGWPILRQENVWQVQSTGMIPGCSFTQGSNVITIGTPPTQAPQVGWVLSTSGGSNATGFAYPTTVTAVSGNQITVSNKASITSSNVSLAFGQESYSLPSDFDYMIPETAWDRGYRWQLLGPLQPAEWQVLKSGLSPTGPRRRFRFFGGSLYLDPIPFDSNTLVYEYYSTSFVLQASGAKTNTFALDNDTYLLPDDLLILGLMWRWRRAKGLDYTQEQETYQRRYDAEIGRAASARALMLNAADNGIRFLGNSQIPDTGFGT